MGGWGSGEWSRWNSHPVADACISLDVRDWQRKDYFRVPVTFGVSWTRNGKDAGDIRVITGVHHVVLSYRTRRGAGDTWEDIDDTVDLAWTPCRLGGKQPWFVCPHCQRHCAKLYCGGKHFVCRICSNLRYHSQRASAQDRAIARERELRKRLGGGPSLLEPFPLKPKGMHERTYTRLFAQYLALAAIQQQAFWAWDLKATARLAKLGITISDYP